MAIYATYTGTVDLVAPTPVAAAGAASGGGGGGFDWTGILAAVTVIVTLAVLLVAYFTLREARKSGSTLKSAAETLHQVLDEERSAGAEARLRHQLERLLAVHTAVLHVVAYWNVAGRVGVLERWGREGAQPALPDPDSVFVSRIQEAQVELQTLLGFFLPDELPATYALAVQDTQDAANGWGAALAEVRGQANVVKQELQRLAGEHGAGDPGVE
jgi:hypothetical protein